MPSDRTFGIPIGKTRQREQTGALRPVAAVVPDVILANAGHDEEVRCYPLVDDSHRRSFLEEE